MEGVIGDRHISRKLKGKVLSSCVTPAYAGLYQIGSAGKASVHATLQLVILELYFVNTYVKHVTWWLAAVTEITDRSV